MYLEIPIGFNYLDIAAVSHMPHFGDSTISPAGDAVSPTEDLLASPNFGICDTTHR